MGDHEETLRILTRARSGWREGGNLSVLAWGATAMGEVELACGNMERASTLLTQGLAGWREIGSAWGEAMALWALGEAARLAGESQGAVQQVRDSLSIRHTLSDKLGTAECLESLSQLAASQGRPGLAARLLGCADGLRESVGAPLPPVKRAWRESIGTHLTEELGQARFERESSAGRSAGFERVPALASDIASGS